MVATMHCVCFSSTLVVKVLALLGVGVSVRLCTCAIYMGY